MLLDYQGYDEGINHDAWVDYHDSMRPGGSPLPMPTTAAPFKDHRAQRFNDLLGADIPLFQAYIDAGYDQDDLPF